MASLFDSAEDWLDPETVGYRVSVRSQEASAKPSRGADMTMEITAERSLAEYLAAFDVTHTARPDRVQTWEARVRTACVPDEVMRELAERTEDEAMREYWASELAIPPFRVPDGYQPLMIRGSVPLAQVDVSPEDLTIIVAQDTELTVIRHPTRSTYQTGLARLRGMAL
jgi:hypothetical protein